MSHKEYHFPTTLCMIVRNEALIIERCLDSVKDHITGWVIIDTGSTDETKKIVSESLADIPGVLLSAPWVDFAHNRTELINEARSWVNLVGRGLNPGYLLLLDADHVFEGDLSGIGDDPGYLIEITGGNLAFRMPYIVAADMDWQYFSPTHEYISAPGNWSYANLDSCTIRHLEDGGTRHEKFERDRELLEKAYESDPNNERTVYYLAQTYEGMGRTDEAIELFKRRTQLGGWDQEIFWAYFRIAEATGKIEDYLTAWLYRPSRGEPLQRAMRILNNELRYDAVIALARSAPREATDDHLFVERWVEEYGLAFEYCLALWWTGNVEAAKQGWEAMLELDTITDYYRQLCTDNLTHC